MSSFDRGLRGRPALAVGTAKSGRSLSPILSPTLQPDGKPDDENNSHSAFEPDQTTPEGGSRPKPKSSSWSGWARRSTSRDRSAGRANSASNSRPSASTERMLQEMAVGDSIEPFESTAAGMVEQSSTSDAIDARTERPSIQASASMQRSLPSSGGVQRLVVAFDRWPLGVGVLRNEESGRIEVISSVAQAQQKGVAVGDVVLEVNGCRLLPGLHHDALKRLLSHSVQLPLHLTLWRASPGKRYMDIVVQWQGRGKVQVVVPLESNPSSSIDGTSLSGGSSAENSQTSSDSSSATSKSKAWLSFTSPRPRVGENGTCVCAEVVAAHAQAPLQAGDLIVGLLGAPLADHSSGSLTGEALAQLLEVYPGGGLLLQVWRPSSSSRAPPVDADLALQGCRMYDNLSVEAKDESIEGFVGGSALVSSDAPLSLASMMSYMSSDAADDLNNDATARAHSNQDVTSEGSILATGPDYGGVSSVVALGLGVGASMVGAAAEAPLNLGSMAVDSLYGFAMGQSVSSPATEVEADVKPVEQSSSPSTPLTPPRRVKPVSSTSVSNTNQLSPRGTVGGANSTMSPNKQLQRQHRRGQYLDGSTGSSDRGSRGGRSGARSAIGCLFSDAILRSELYSVVSAGRPWLFEHARWAGEVEAEWHTTLLEEVSDGSSNEATTRTANGESTEPDSVHTASTSPLPLSRESPRATPTQLRKRRAADDSSSGASHVVDGSILLTDEKLYLIHRRRRSSKTADSKACGLITDTARGAPIVALELEPWMIVEVALPYYTVRVHGDEVAVRSSELALRLSPKAIDAFDRMHAKQEAPPSAADASYRWSPPASETSQCPPPPWRVSNHAHNGGDRSPESTLQHSLIIMTASNMHRAELLEAIAAWANAERDPDASPLKVDQVPFSGSPPQARGLWRLQTPRPMAASQSNGRTLDSLGAGGNNHDSHGSPDSSNSRSRSSSQSSSQSHSQSPSRSPSRDPPRTQTDSPGNSDASAALSQTTQRRKRSSIFSMFSSSRKT